MEAQPEFGRESNMGRPSFGEQGPSLCLLIGAFTLFMDKLIISKHALITILLIV